MSDAGNQHNEDSVRAPRRWWWLALALALVLLLVLALAAALGLRRHRLQTRLLQDAPDVAASDPQLVQFATAQAKPLYQRYCASCHGQNLRGNSALGAPNLIDKVWLYGDGSVHEIERTVLYGIRSGHGKAHNVTDMPAFGSTGRLSPDEINEEVQYLLQLSGRDYQVGAANEGRALYLGKGGCGDCHGYDAHGSPDYGAPDLTLNVWNSGSDPQSLYNAIYFGEHHLMPAWSGILSLEQIRALAVYLHSAAQPGGSSAGAY